MSNASLKEQLQAIAPQLSDKSAHATKPHLKPKQHQSSPAEKITKPVKQPAKPKPKWLDYVQYGVELLKTYFPACFKNLNDVQPLKKGIKQDLLLRLSTIETIVTEDKACMVKSLAYYVNTAAYHKSVIEGVLRIDLDGNSVGPVSAEEAKYSIDRKQAKLQAKQQAKTQQIQVLSGIPAAERGN